MKKLISAILLFAVALGLICATPIKTQAVNDRGWSFVFEPNSGKLKIAFKANATTTVEFSQYDGEADYYIRGNWSDGGAQVWASIGNAISPKLHVITSKVQDTTNGEIIDKSTSEILNICMDKIALDGKSGISTSSNDVDQVEIEYENGRKNYYYCFNTKLYDPDLNNTPQSWFDDSLGILYPDSKTEAAVLSTIKSLYPDWIVKLEYKRPGSPKPENVEACKSTIVQPMFSGLSDAELNKRVAEIKDSLANDKANSDDMDVINEYFDDPDFKSHLKSVDAQVYSHYYSTKVPAEYPNVLLTSNLQKDMVRDFAEVGQPLSNDPSKWNNATLDDAAAGLAGLGAGVLTGANPWVGAGTTMAAFYGINSAQGFLLTNMTRDEIKKALDGYIKVYLDSYYLVANNDFNKCLAEKGDAYAYVNDKVAKAAESLQSQATSIGANTNTGAPNECGPSGFIALMQLGFKRVLMAAFCNVALFIHKFVFSFLGWVTGQFTSVVGIRDF